MKSYYTVFYYLFILFITTACVNDTPKTVTTNVTSIQLGNKVYIINEGQFQNNPGNASISLYDAKSGQLIDNIFNQQNNKVLGDICQSMNKIGMYYYLVVNNSKKIEVVSSTDFKSVATVVNLNSPRYILSVTVNKAYISEYYQNGIYVLNTNTNKITNTITCKSGTEEMALIYNKAFVTSINSAYCYIINTITDKIIDSVQVGFNASSILIDANSKVWVLSSGNSNKQSVAQLIRIDPISLQTELALTFSPLEAPRKLCINKSKDTLYYLNKHVYQLSINAISLPAMPFIIQASKNFYGLGINPIDYNIYVSDAIDYTQKSTIEVYTPKGNYVTKFKAGIISNGFLFENN